MGDVQGLTQINYWYVFISVIAILVGIKFLISLGEWFFNRFGIETKNMRQKREDRELLKKTSENLLLLQEKHNADEKFLEKCLSDFVEESKKENEELRNEMKRFTQNRVDDREKSRNIQKELVDTQTEMSNRLTDIANKLDQMKRDTDVRFKISEEKQNKHVQSNIKEKIAKSYKRYHIAGKISQMELEALEDLISTYETYGGENSFVHSVVQKEMYTWEIV